MVAIMLGADNGFFYAGQVMHFSSPFTVFLIYHKHLSASRQLEWFLQDIDSDATVQVHADAYLYGEGEVVNATHAELCYFLDRMRLNPNFLESRCQSAGSSDFSFNWSQEELFGLKFSS